MEKKLRNIITTITLAALCIAPPVFSIEPESKHEISNFTSRYLKGKGFDVQESHFVPQQEGKFPFNITIDIKKTEIDSPVNGLETGKPAAAEIQDVVFAFTQDYFCKKPEFIVDFINITIENKLPYNCTILLSPDSEQIVLDTPQHVSGGTDFFADRVYDTESTCAYVIFDDEFSPRQISSTGGGRVSPMWIVKTAEKAFRTKQQPISVQSGLLYSTRAQLFKENPRLSSFKENEITCAGIPLGHTLKDLDVLRTIQMDLIESRNSEKNTHYNNLSIGSISIWINESLLTVIYLAFSAIVLVSLCFFSFKYNAKNEAIFKDIGRTWFILPVYILMSTMFLTVFQKVFFFTKECSPILYFSLKSLFSIILLFMISSIQITKRLRISISAISFQTKTICALNIFVFTFMDLSLMFVFIIQYLMVFISHKTQSKALAFTSLGLLVLPMLLPSTSLFINTDPVKIGNLFNSTIIENIGYSLIIIPFVFQWIRCALILNIGEHKGGKNKKLISVVSTSCIFAVILFSFFICGTVGIVHKLTKTTEQERITIEESSENMAILEYSHSSSYDLVNHKVTINCSEGKRIERCIATITSESGAPLYDSNFNYIMKSANSAILEIPDGAEKDIVLKFSTGSKTRTTLLLDLYILTDKTRAFHERKKIELTGRDDDGRTI